jgi:hypothetical protein
MVSSAPPVQQPASFEEPVSSQKPSSPTFPKGLDLSTVVLRKTSPNGPDPNRLPFGARRVVDGPAAQSTSVSSLTSALVQPVIQERVAPHVALHHAAPTRSNATIPVASEVASHAYEAVPVLPTAAPITAPVATVAAAIDERLVSFLRDKGLQSYGPLFQKEKVSLEDLPLLSDADLKDMGLPMGPRRRILSSFVKQFK